MSAKFEVRESLGGYTVYNNKLERPECTYSFKSNAEYDIEMRLGRSASMRKKKPKRKDEGEEDEENEFENDDDFE